jgi:hypothetical protein
MSDAKSVSEKRKTLLEGEFEEKSLELIGHGENA